ncbi:hypothetical protein [Flavobacterium sp. 245]|uniref:hypothetical protein n=1 Tax=Flavobacterium sp. 245 TaxID=2512115 RepID=UPI00105F1162|nr:hypothetical protein [Flavobacterium sp. 245]TDP02451.1 hypothetical protein EV145_103441 [Flavobacterium sp. 245]
MNDSKDFICNRNYRIWMYTVSHCTLILRSEKQYFDVEYNDKYDNPNTTIDVILNGVDFISIPSNFDGIYIKKDNDKFIFNNNENWYVKAFNCWIGKYDGEIEDQIWQRDLDYDEIIHL